MKKPTRKSTPTSDAAPSFSGYVGMAKLKLTFDGDWQIVLREHKQTGEWEAVERHVDRNTKAVTINRTQTFPTRAAALKLCRQWKREMTAVIRQCAVMRAKANPAALVGTFAPDGCRDVTTTDMEDAAKAEREQLRIEWPRCAKVLDALDGKSSKTETKQPRARLAKAYVLDRAALTGRLADASELAALVANDTPEVEAAFFIELSEALKDGQARATAPQRAKAMVDDAVNLDLRLNWLATRYCFKTFSELAALLNARHGAKLTAAALKTRLRRLGLATKRKPGPMPRDNW
jgi:hypothetical protein